MDRPSLLSNMSPFSKLLFLIMVVFTTFLVTVFLGFLVGIPFFGTSFFTQLGNADLTTPEYIPLLKYFQILSQFGLFIFPPLIFAYLMNRKVAPYLLTDKSPDYLTSVMVCCLIVLSMPLIGWLIEINEKMQLPAFLKGMESWMKESEAEAEGLTKIFLGTSSWRGFSVNLLMIVLLPAIGEELIFRGVLIRLFREWTGNIHWAVIIAAIMFSAMHMQFYGFIPRLVLGLLLGYVFVWSANLWMPVLMHLINNGITVIAAFFIARGYIHTDLDQLGNQPAAWEIILSVFMTILLLGLIFYRQKKIRFH